ncbi:MAG: hypothetical protein JO308_06195 [Verrucomicrobia bacterium]|nr:hypothetical protein [Verrucomicrobiota bacterium]
MKGSYRKLAESSIKFRFLPGIRSALYLGEDHLLLSTQMILVERYRRFFFRDIQTIAAAKSSRWVWAACVWLVPFVFSSLWFIGQSWGYYLTGGVSLLVFGALFVASLLAGPTYVVEIRTAVQRQRLRPIERAGKYRRFCRDVLPLILQAQLAEPSRTEVAT